MDEIVLLGSYHASRTDRDGEAKLTLLIPASHAPLVSGITKLCLLRITIEEELS